MLVVWTETSSKCAGSSLNFRHGASSIEDRRFATLQRTIFIYLISGFGGLEVACWPLVPKFAGSNPAEAVGFLRVNKNPQHVGGNGCLSVVIVVCCQVEVSATN